MASPLNNFDFPYFPLPPPPAVKPPSPSIPPPSPHTFTPPPPHIIPPPPSPHTSTPPPPHVIPPPSSPPHIILPPPSPHTFTPPPPHIIPPPPPPPPSSPDNHSTVIVIVFVSFGGLFFLAFLAIALCCFIKKKKKKVQETDIVHVDEHLKVKEAIVEGPHGSQAVVLSIEDDVHIEEEIWKNEKFGEGGKHLCCFIKKNKKVQETDNVHVDEHLKVREAIVQGPHGSQAVVLSIEDDVHIEEEIGKNEKFGEGGMHVKSADNIPGALEEGTSASRSSHHLLEHNH